MNPIVESIIEKRNGHYVHAIEVNNVDELTSCLENLIEELINDWKKTQIIEFIETLQIYCLMEKNEDDVYDFDINNYTKDILE